MTSDHYWRCCTLSPTESKPLYDAVQAVIFGNDCDLSCYRFRRGLVQYVAVIGQQPSVELDTALQSLFAPHQLAIIPSDVEPMLWERRKQILSPSVVQFEGHYS